MKKFLLIILVLLFTFTGFHSVKAEDPDIVWTSDNIYSNYYALRGVLDFDPDAKHITFQLADSSYHALLVAGIEAEIVFSDDLGAEIISFNFEDYFGDDFDVFIDIDLDALGVVGAYTMTIIIPQTYGSTPVGYTAYMDDNDSLTVWYDIPDHRVSYFTYDASNDYIVSKVHSVDSNSSLLNLLFPDIDFYETNLGDDSFVELKNSSSILLDAIPLSEYLTYPNYVIDLEDGGSYAAADVAYFQVFLKVDPITSFNFIDNANRNFIYYFDDDAITVRFYANGAIYDSFPSIVGTIPATPIDPPDDDIEKRYFQYWTDGLGNRYDFTAITQEDVQGGYVSYYAFYLDGDVAIDFDFIDVPPDPEGNFIIIGLEAAGFNDPVSRVIVYAFVIIGASLFLLWRKTGVFAIIVVDALISFFFMFLGLIPLFVSAVIIMVFIYLGWSYVGGSTNEI